MIVHDIEQNKDVIWIDGKKVLLNVLLSLEPSYSIPPNMIRRVYDFESKKHFLSYRDPDGNIITHFKLGWDLGDRLTLRCKEFLESQKSPLL